MVVSGKGKGKTGVRHQNQKVKGSGKAGKKGDNNAAPVEKRMDPSDGNGPFTYASFIKFHGDAKGVSLWNKAGKAVSGNLKPAAGQGNYQKFSGGNNKVVQKKGNGKVGNNNNNVANQNQNKGKGKGKSQNKGKGKKGGKAKSNVEKRTDPSDGNGPFTKESFIRFHGEEKGEELWEQAGTEKELNDLLGDDAEENMEEEVELEEEVAEEEADEE